VYIIPHRNNKEEKEMLRKDGKPFRVNVVWSNGVDTNHYFFTADGAHSYMSELRENATNYQLFQDGDLVAEKPISYS